MAIEGMSPSMWEKILKIADYHKTMPLLFYKIKEFKSRSVGTIPDEIYSKLQRTYQINLIRNTLILEEFQGLNSAFKKEGIPIILLKGIFFLHTLHRNTVGIRRMEDVDILIRENDIERTDNILRSYGYLPYNKCVGSVSSLSGGRKTMMYFKYKAHSALMPIHLHWHIVNLSPLMFTLNWSKIDMADIWAFSQPLTEENLNNIFIMHPEHMLLSLCEHGLRHGFCRMNILYDIHSYIGSSKFCMEEVPFWKRGENTPLRPLLIEGNYSPFVKGDEGGFYNDMLQYKDFLDWDKLTDLAYKWQLVIPLYIGLLLSQRMFHTKLPLGFLERLRPEGISFFEKYFIRYVTRNNFPKEDACVLLYLSINHGFFNKLKFALAGLFRRFYA